MISGTIRGKGFIQFYLLQVSKDKQKPMSNAVLKLIFVIIKCFARGRLHGNLIVYMFFTMEEEESNATLELP